MFWISLSFSNSDDEIFGEGKGSVMIGTWTMSGKEGATEGKRERMAAGSGECQ